MKRLAAFITLAALMGGAARAAPLAVEATFSGTIEASPVAAAEIIGGDDVLPAMIRGALRLSVDGDNPDHFAERDASVFSFDGGGPSPEVTGSLVIGETLVRDFDVEIFALSNTGLDRDFDGRSDGPSDVFGLAFEFDRPFQLGRATVLALDLFAAAAPMTLPHGGPVDLLETGSLFEEFVLSLTIIENDNVEAGPAFVRLRLDGFDVDFDVSEALAAPLPGAGVLLVSGAIGALSLSRRRRRRA